MILKRWIPLALVCCLMLWGCLPSSKVTPQGGARPTEPRGQRSEMTAVATFAGGCFWCLEKPYDQIPGVFKTTSGYTGGQSLNPTYGQVSSGKTGHTESVQVIYDPNIVSYETLLDTFWKNVDPFDSGGQFCDRGTQYRSEIFYDTEEQKALAEVSKKALAKTHHLKNPVVTPISALKTFYPAEDYHQDYYLKNPLHYKFYRRGCGRDQRLAQLWGKETAH